MNIYQQIHFLQGVHLRALSIIIMGSCQSGVPTKKVLRDLRKAKKENARIDSYIHAYAKKAEWNLKMEEIPF